MRIVFFACFVMAATVVVGLVLLLAGCGPTSGAPAKLPATPVWRFSPGSGSHGASEPYCKICQHN